MLLININILLCHGVELSTLAIDTLSTSTLAMIILSYCVLCLVREILAGLIPCL